ncbi:MAG: hypothetical protein JWN48_568 [Myxococcaceae bacterium]|nr:hypothetical protein [Myxococcaceae bacterium]
MTSSVAIRSLPVSAQPPPFAAGRFDYADAFEVVFPRVAAQPSAVDFLRGALEAAPPPLLLVARTAWLLLGFRLGPSDSTQHIVGWRIVGSRADAVQLEVFGALADAVLVARVTTTGASVTTHLRYVRPRFARAVWAVAGVAHRRIAPLLLERAALALPTAPERNAEGG